VQYPDAEAGLASCRCTGLPREAAGRPAVRQTMGENYSDRGIDLFLGIWVSI